MIMRKVVCAAIRNQSKLIICGARHFDSIMCNQIESSTDDWDGAEQGFIDQFGFFMTREEAYDVAVEAEQIIRRVGGDEGKLFSENLY
jgi:hypothetical protein